MNQSSLLLVWLALSVLSCSLEASPPITNDATPKDRSDFIVLPNRTNDIQFRLYTNTAPAASHLFNTFEIEAYGKPLLQGPNTESLRRLLRVAPTNNTLQNLLVNGVGPDLSATNGVKILDQASGPDWAYVALDLTFAYRAHLEEYKRGILFVAPDLFVLHDHLVGRERMSFEMFLHPSAATRVDPDWHDLRLDTPQASLRIHAPSRGRLRTWEQIDSPADAVLPDTITAKIGPTNEVSQVDLLTVFAIQPRGRGMDYVFKLVESDSAIGARIQRDGLPTLVAFRSNPAYSNSSLDSFKFAGPAGVAVFRPKRITR